VFHSISVYFNFTALALEYYGYSSWNDSTLSAYLNSSQSESILIADQFQIAAHNEKHPNDKLTALDESFFGYYDSLLFQDLDRGPESIIFEKTATLLRENGILHRAMLNSTDLNYFKPQPLSNEPSVELNRARIWF